MFLNQQLSNGAAQIHLVLETDHRRAARKPAHAVDRGGTGRPEDGVREERLDGLRGVDVNRGHVRPRGAESLEPRLHDPHHVRGLLAHRLGRGLAVADDSLDADTTLCTWGDAGGKSHPLTRGGSGEFREWLLCFLCSNSLPQSGETRPRSECAPRPGAAAPDALG